MGEEDALGAKARRQAAEVFVNGIVSDGRGSTVFERTTAGSF